MARLATELSLRPRCGSDGIAIELRNDLASAHNSAGDVRRAVLSFEQTLTDCERVLGPDHPNTLTSRNNLAHAYGSAGNLGPIVAGDTDTAARIGGTVWDCCTDR
ncbi:tetratricopeptide repeat protein [Promicromonospora sukumoe]|uniref:tetratricopeptide repeat protein n=1 Tax=Promicromonospora sukumoe TaxID=88382 RepID=UPI00365BCAF5